jgi:hypothetical protein
VHGWSILSAKNELLKKKKKDFFFARNAKGRTVRLNKKANGDHIAEQKNKPLSLFSSPHPLPILFIVYNAV